MSNERLISGRRKSDRRSYRSHWPASYRRNVHSSTSIAKILETWRGIPPRERQPRYSRWMAWSASRWHGRPPLRSLPRHNVLELVADQPELQEQRRNMPALRAARGDTALDQLETPIFD